MTTSVIEHDKFITHKPIISVCGKGGVGKTVFSALLGRVIVENGLKPLLLVDADPVGGLVSAIGEKAVKTLSGVRDMFIEETRKGGRVSSRQIADQLDYFILNALVENHDYSFQVLTHSGENKFRVKQTGLGVAAKYSNSVALNSMTDKPTFMFSKNKKAIQYSFETSFEVYDAFGTIVKKGFGNETNIENLPKGKYYLCFDNQVSEFDKK